MKMNINDMLQLSFEKLESFDMNKSSLSSFVLIRNSIINELTKKDALMEDVEEQEVWLDNCIHALEQHDEEDIEDEDDDMPLSPPYYTGDDDDQNTYLIKDQQQQQQQQESFYQPYYNIPYY